MTTAGRLITLEGGEGGGKSTHCATVAAWLRRRGRQVVETREPGGSPLAEALRGLFLRDWDEGIDACTETLMLFAARAAHLHATIRPALASGRDVVCDRFVDASYAYQGAGRGVSRQWLAALEQQVLGATRPDLVLVFDLDPRIGLERTHQRGDENRFEKENLRFLDRVRNAYLDRARAEPERYAVVDATQPIEVVRNNIETVLETRM
ncbi:MAG: dTMP kinase [Nevskiaceae bacterium]|nr:MAG: dTMP kinase [Nevskiaceae bacterium]TBR74772.1 MAG: dTMP kinase [Nevskiaceae bacterium]